MNTGTPVQTVLVVDDNEANRALAQHTLEDEGYRVLLAIDGAKGVAAFEEHQPDCVILDVRMPEVDGITACARIRALPGGTDVPVIFLTALRDVDTFDRALHAGGDDFLTKPVRPAELIVRVQAALQLRRLRTELHVHYDLLRKQRDDLMRLQLQKERLAAFVVHDLKNPVNTLDLHAQILLRDKGLSETARQSASQIRAEARLLNRMILDLLDLSKADEGKLAPRSEAVDLRALVTGVLDELEVVAKARKVELAHAVGTASARGDPDLLRRTVANLVENAIRHAPQKSAVRVETSGSEGALLLRVTDAGSGIPEEMRERIFDPFVQADAGATATRAAGRGLGLAFCRMVAEAHGGTIWVEDAAPGASFCVRIPQ